MPTNEFIGTATEVVQVDTCTPATIEIDDVFTLTVTGFDGTSDSISYTAVDTSATTVSGALIAAWNLEAGDLFSGITASGTATVILTADVAGVAFKVASSAVDGGGADTQTFTRVATTANGGPSDWQDADNWTLNAPGENGAGEDTIIADSAVDIMYGLGNTGASNTLDTCKFKKSYTGKVGWDEDAGFVGAYLQISTSKLFIGENFDDLNVVGSSRIKVDVGLVACEITVYNTSTQSDTNKPACRLLAVNQDSLLRDVRKGTVGLAFLDGEVSTVGKIFQSHAGTVASDSQVTIGTGVTMTAAGSFDGDIEAVGGKTTVKCAGITITNSAGTMLTVGEGTITTLNVDGGTVTPASTGEITTANCKGGTTDFTASAEPRTVTNLKAGQGAKFKVNEDVVILTNGITAIEAGRQQYTVASA